QRWCRAMRLRPGPPTPAWSACCWCWRCWRCNGRQKAQWAGAAPAPGRGQARPPPAGCWGACCCPGRWRWRHGGRSDRRGVVGQRDAQRSGALACRTLVEFLARQEAVVVAVQLLELVANGGQRAGFLGAEFAVAVGIGLGKG